MQIQTAGPVQRRQMERAKEIKRRLYGGQTEDKNKIYQLTEQVKHLRNALDYASQEANDSAMMEIRELTIDLQHLQEKHTKLINELSERGLGRFVETAMTDVEEAKPVIPAAAIISAVSIASKIGINDRHGERRQQHLVFWRSVEAWIMKEYTRRSYPSIGKALGGRDHSTIIHHVRKVNANYPHYAKAIEAVEGLL